MCQKCKILNICVFGQAEGDYNMYMFWIVKYKWVGFGYAVANNLITVDNKPIAIL